MKNENRKNILSLDMFDYDQFLLDAKKQESRSVAWLDNYKPIDDYQFPTHKLSHEGIEYYNTSDIKVNELKVESDLFKVINSRKSETMNYLISKWSDSELFFLLERSIGLRGTVRRLKGNLNQEVYFRKYPSGGSMYPVTAIIYINRVDNINKGFYEYYPIEQKLVKISEPLTDQQYEYLFPMSKYKFDRENCDIKKSAFSIFLVSNYKFSFAKYGTLAYKLSILESGHMAQNLLLVATALYKKNLPVCGLFADVIKNHIDMDNKNFIHYGIIFG